MLIVGIGSKGINIAADSSKNLSCDCLLISNNQRDLDRNHRSIFINSNPWINPSTYRIRSFGQSSEAMFRSHLEGFSTVVLVANLGGKCGSAIAPMIGKISKQTFSTRILTFVIMPFRFEKDRIFHAGISLKRLRHLSDATVVFDNDALLENNPDLSLDQCQRIAESALGEIVTSIATNYLERDMNLLCTGGKANSSAKLHVKDCLSMLYQSTGPDTITRATLYVMNRNQISIGTVNSIIGTVQTIFKNKGTSNVSLSLSDSPDLKLHLLVSVEGKTRFDTYDPLGEIIPMEKTLDWEEMDSSPDFQMAIQNME